MSTAERFEAIIALLESKEIDHKVHEHEAVLTLQDILEKLPFPDHLLLKTLVFQLDDGRWVFAAIRGRDRVDYKKLSTVLDVRRQDIRGASKETVVDELGFDIGGVCPIASDLNPIVLFDQKTTGMEKVCCGSGRNDRTIEMSYVDLMKISNGQPSDITKDI